MRCQICKENEATIHLTEITDGLRNEMHLCELCAEEEGITIKSQVSINELLSSLLAAKPTDEELLGDSERKLSCPRCGFTLEQFHKKGLLGCPYDYEVFDKILSVLIEKAHDGQTVHRGKVPSKTPTQMKSQIELLDLRRQLDAAVKSEDYEKAAKLRDKINQIEN